MSRFNKEVAKNAINIAKGLIHQTMKNNVVKRSHLHIVVGNTDGKILAEKSIGEPDEWKHPYKEIALSKFDLTVRHQKTTREIQLLYPELSGEEGDTFFWGSYIDGGIVVACSGVEAYFDEMYSKIIASIARALVTKYQEDEMSKGENFR